jgi:flagellin-like protein
VRTFRPLGRDRRGISPLIATVLLLAFAVAVGTMAVSYIAELARTDPCDPIDLAVQESVPICYKDETVHAIVTNRGEEAIASIMTTLLSPNGDVTDYRNPVLLEVGSSMKLSVPFRTIYPEGVTVTLVPTTMVDGKERFCFEREIKTTLQACAQ